MRWLTLAIIATVRGLTPHASWQGYTRLPCVHVTSYHAWSITLLMCYDYSSCLGKLPCVTCSSSPRCRNMHTSQGKLLCHAATASLMHACLEVHGVGECFFFHVCCFTQDKHCSKCYTIRPRRCAVQQCYQHSPSVLQ